MHLTLDLCQHGQPGLYGECFLIREGYDLFRSQSWHWVVFKKQSTKKAWVQGRYSDEGLGDERECWVSTEKEEWHKGRRKMGSGLPQNMIAQGTGQDSQTPRGNIWGNIATFPLKEAGKQGLMPGTQGWGTERQSAGFEKLTCVSPCTAGIYLPMKPFPLVLFLISRNCLPLLLLLTASVFLSFSGSKKKYPTFARLLTQTSPWGAHHPFSGKGMNLRPLSLHKTHFNLAGYPHLRWSGVSQPASQPGGKKCVSGVLQKH